MSNRPGLSELSAIERYRTIAATFSDRVRGTSEWGAPTPVEGWVARDVVAHLSSWLPGLIAAGSSVRLDPVPDAQTNPVGAWEATDRQVLALLEAPASEQIEFSHRHIGVMPLPAMLDQFFTNDVLFHTWDLARATGQDDRLDADYLAGALDGMIAQEEMIRASGQFGEQQPLPHDASVQERFFAFIGRDPRWTPPSGGGVINQ